MKSLTAINKLKEPIKGHQHYNISDNESDNKVDWQGPIRAQARRSHPNCIGRITPCLLTRMCAVTLTKSLMKVRSPVCLEPGVAVEARG